MYKLTAICLTALSLSVSAQNIKNARQQPLGTEVTVSGFVTVPSGSFEGFSFDKGFAIEDEQAGIYISMPTDLNLQLNKNIKVTGTLASSFNQLILLTDKTQVERLKGAKKTHPAPIVTGDINDQSEGYLVQTTATVVSEIQNDLPYGWKFLIDDGSGEVTVFIASTVKFDPMNIPWLKVGQDIQVTGLSSEFDDHFEINPRKRGDILPVNN